MAERPVLNITTSIATFTQSVYQAFTDVEARAQEEVACAQSDAQEARRERDHALNCAHNAQLEAQKLREEIGLLKALLKQTETTSAHQAETIAQLRREANHVKDQSKNWQDHFLRVEAERCSLMTKLDELVSDRLIRNSERGVAPLTPVSRHADDDQRYEISDSEPPRASHGGSLLSPPDPETPPKNTKSARYPKTPLPQPSHRKVAPQSAKSRGQPQTPKSRQPQLPADASGSTTEPIPQQPTTKLIRRVHAIVRVKQEESDDEGGPLEDVPNYPPPDAIASTSRQQVQTPGRRQKTVEELFNDEDAENRSESEYEEADEYDELNMSGPDRRSRDYGTTPSNKRTATTRAAAPPTKKRKLGTAPTNTRTKGAAKRK